MESISSDIIVENLPQEMMKTKPNDDELGFGTEFTDRMFLQEFKGGQWQTGRIMPFQNFSLSPAALVFHYGQAIFEGLKAYKHPDGSVALFRPEKNAQRFHRSAKRMMMAPVPEEFFLESVEKLVALEHEWIPRKLGTSLYIRPTMIATQAVLGVKPSEEYYYFIILSPSSAYFKEGFSPVKIMVSDKYVRAAVGGVGDAKTAGNYAASLYAGYLAKKEGYSQVLWLDAKENRYVEEVGAMNIAFVMDDIIYTPPLRGSILPGVTRDSILKLAPDLGYKVKEEALAIDVIEEAAKSGNLTEVFGMGTAAVIAPVGELKYKDDVMVINNGEIGKITKDLYSNLTGIQYGTLDDPYGWVKKIQI